MSSLASLESLELRAAERGLLLRLQVGRPLGVLYGLRVAVAQQMAVAEQGPSRLQLLGELKGWAWPHPAGLHLDTLQVVGRRSGPNPAGVGSLAVGPLIVAATFAWALEQTPCRRAQILAIRDDGPQHRLLVRYFRRLGLVPRRELGAALWDLPERLLWGGSGLLMEGDCEQVLERSLALLDKQWK